MESWASVAETLPLDRELKVTRETHPERFADVAETLPLDRELKGAVVARNAATCGLLQRLSR